MAMYNHKKTHGQGGAGVLSFLASLNNTSAEPEYLDETWRSLSRVLNVVVGELPTQHISDIPSYKEV